MARGTVSKEKNQFQRKLTLKKMSLKLIILKKFELWLQDQTTGMKKKRE